MSVSPGLEFSSMILLKMIPLLLVWCSSSSMPLIQKLGLSVESALLTCSVYIFLLVRHWPLQTNPVSLPCRPALIHTLSILLVTVSRGHPASAST